MADTTWVPEIGAACEVTIERVVYGGDGMGRLPDGRVIFVPLTAPGERVRAEVTEVQRSFLRGRSVETIAASPHRRSAPCPHFGVCGGCQLQHLDYETQKNVKAEFIRDALRRIGKIDWMDEIPMIAGPEWGYRGRVQFKLEADAGGGGPRVGFFAGGSHDLREIEECLLLHSTLNEAIGVLRKAPGAALPRGIGTVDLATDGANGLTASREGVGIPLGAITRSIAGLAYTFDARCFFQVNLPLIEALVREVVPEDATGRTAVDLYAGVGLFTLALARRFETVFGAEEAGAAAHYALSNVARNGFTNVTFTRQSTESWLARSPRLVGNVDFLVVDPPRAGLSAKVVDGIIRLRPRRMTYVSCDPASLARDLRKLCDAGFGLESVTGVDLFPQTFHVESIVRLRFR